MIAALPVASREFVRTLRQPAHLVATLLTPIAAWLMFSGGLAGAFAGDSAAAALAPGTALLVVLFGALYAGMTLTDERERLWVRTALAEGVPAPGLAAGKLIAGAALSCAQAVLVLGLLSLTAGDGLPASPFAATGVLLLTAVGAGGMALGLACLVRTARAFHGLINLLLMPAWLLSGALFPLDDAAAWVRTLAVVNPAAWAQQALVSCLESGAVDAGAVAGVGGFALAGASVAAASLGRVRTK